MAQKPALVVIHPRSALIGSTFILSCLAIEPHAVLIPAGPIPERSAVLPELDPRIFGLAARHPGNRKDRRREARLGRSK